MNLKILKLFVGGAFVAFAASVFLFSSGRSQAQTGVNNERRDEILERVAGYKTWKQVLKPEKPVDEADKNKVQPVFSGAAGG